MTEVIWNENFVRWVARLTLVLFAVVVLGIIGVVVGDILLPFLVVALFLIANWTINKLFALLQWAWKNK